jgi:transposase
MAHARAKLTVAGRQLLVARITAGGYTISRAAEAQGVIRATAAKWLRRYRLEGTAGLLDRSSRPKVSPRRLDERAERAILAARQASRYGPHRLAYLTGRPRRSTCYAVLRRHGLSRLADADRVTGVPVRYVACPPQHCSTRTTRSSVGCPTAVASRAGAATPVIARKASAGPRRAGG